MFSGLGETPWWAHGSVTVSVCLSLGSASSAKLLPRPVVLWTILLCLIGLGLSASGQARRLDQLRSTVTPQVFRLRLVWGYVGLLGAGAAPYLWWAWTRAGDARTLTLVAAMAGGMGLLLATRSGLMAALASSLVLVTLAAGSAASRLLLALTMGAVLCALAFLGKLPGDSSRVPARKSVARLLRPSLIVAAVISVLIGLALEGPINSILSRFDGGSFSSTPGGRGGVRSSRTPQNNDLSESIFRPGSTGSGGGTLQSTNSFSIDRFGGADTTPVITARYWPRSQPFASSNEVLLRGQAFDQWDGKTWTANPTEKERSSGSVMFDRSEDRSVEPQVTGAQIEVLSGSTDLVFGEGRIASVDVGVDTVRVSADETIRTSTLMGKGTRYTVFSARHPWRDAGPPTPRGELNGGIGQFALFGVRDDHLAVPKVSARTRALALELGNSAESIEGVERNIERWLAAHTGYDFTARQATNPNDVVDDFLFTSKRGWCEQISTATVVMLRINGIPARLATGYLPSVIRADGSLTALSRDAHAWVEMYLPGRGWAPRDPTAVVPLIKGPPAVKAKQTLFSARILLLALSGFGVLALLWFASQRLRRVRPGWRDVQIASLQKLGSQRGTARSPSQTLSEYGGTLQQSGAVPDVRVASVVALLERERFAPERQRSTEEDRAWVEATLADLERQFPKPKRRIRRGRGRSGVEP
jgi:Transglutaminase-like superfamily